MRQRASIKTRDRVCAVAKAAKEARASEARRCLLLGFNASTLCTPGRSALDFFTRRFAESGSGKDFLSMVARIGSKVDESLLELDITEPEGLTLPIDEDTLGDGSMLAKPPHVAAAAESAGTSMVLANALALPLGRLSPDLLFDLLWEFSTRSTFRSAMCTSKQVRSYLMEFTRRHHFIVPCGVCKGEPCGRAPLLLLCGHTVCRGWLHRFILNRCQKKDGKPDSHMWELHNNRPHPRVLCPECGEPSVMAHTPLTQSWPLRMKPIHLGDLLPDTQKWRHLRERAHSFINDMDVEKRIDDMLARAGIEPQAAWDAIAREWAWEEQPEKAVRRGIQNNPTQAFLEKTRGFQMLHTAVEGDGHVWPSMAGRVRDVLTRTVVARSDGRGDPDAHGDAAVLASLASVGGTQSMQRKRRAGPPVSQPAEFVCAAAGRPSSDVVYSSGF